MRDRMNATINAGSMADIAFLLLMFFLVATTIESPVGIQVVLPEISEDPPLPISEDRVLTVQINATNQVMVESVYTAIDEISNQVVFHVEELVSLKEQPIVSLVTNTDALYNTYISVYDEIRSAYTDMRNQRSQSLYGKDFAALNRENKKTIISELPMVISEADYHPKK